MIAIAGLRRERFISSLYAALVAHITPLVCVSIIASLILFSSHRYIAKVPPNGNPTKQGHAESSSSHYFLPLFFFDRYLALEEPDTKGFVSATASLSSTYVRIDDREALWRNLAFDPLGQRMIRLEKGDQRIRKMGPHDWEQCAEGGFSS